MLGGWLGGPACSVLLSATGQRGRHKGDMSKRGVGAPLSANPAFGPAEQGIMLEMSELD